MLDRAVLAVIFFSILFWLFRVRPAFGTVASLVYLALIGGVRRWLIPLVGYSGNDPLLLVVPAVLVARAMTLRKQKGVHHSSRLTTMTLWLLGLMLLQACNPLQEEIAVGIGGIVFYVIPMLWFFVGRQYGTVGGTRLLLRTIVVIGILAASYGLYQTWYGFNAGEMAWLNEMKTKGSYQALNVGVIRAFSFFTSAAEYACFLGITFVVLWAAFLQGSWTAIVPLPLIGVALFLESSRGIIVLTLFASSVIWAVQGRSRPVWIARGVVALVVGFCGLGWSISQLEDQEFDERIDPLIGHQMEGFADPFSEDSTAPGHADRVQSGIWYGITHPWGAGLGATTIAAGKFGGSDLGTEGDLSNLFVSLGIVGGILYAAVIFMALKTALEFWRLTRHWISLSIVGILVVQILNWLNTGQYSTVMLIWFLLGSMEGILAQLRMRMASLHEERRSTHSIPSELGEAGTRYA